MPRSEITVRARPPAVPELYARMDVAAFVGFAAAGPVDVPVPVEDAVHFRAIFGDDLPLAWNEAAGALHYAYLGPAVRAFFRGGGRRCWVIRVAAGAVPGRFLVPGLMATSGGTYRSVLLQARSEGSWSDALAAETVLVRVRLGAAAPVAAGPAQSYVDVPKGMKDRVRPGDLLRLTWPDLELFLPTDYIVGQQRRGAEGLLQHAWRVHGREFWLRTAGPTPAPGEALGVLWRDPLDPDAPPRVLPGLWQEPFLGQHQLYLAADLPLSSGALLEVPLADGGVLLFATTGVRPVTWEERQRWPAAPAGPVWVATAREARWPLSPAAGRALAADRPGSLERLTFELWARDGEGTTLRLGDLGFVREHERFLGYLPGDAALYTPADERPPLPDGPAPGEALWADVTEPRFPLAIGDDDWQRVAETVYLPIGMDERFRPEEAALPLPDPRPAMERDGLATYGPELFLDPDLKDVPAEQLAAEAYRKRHTQRRRLRGLHAAWPLTEATLLSLPDSLHPGWERVQPLPDLAVPLLAVAYTAAGGARLSWEPVPGADRYRLQWAADPDFRPMAGERLLTECEAPLAPDSGGRFYRVRAERAGERGGWSGGVWVELPRPDFTAVGSAPAPALRYEPLGEGRCRLSWTVVPGADYRLEHDHDPDFDDPLLLYSGGAAEYELWLEGEGAEYYRVRAVLAAGGVTPWSATLVLRRRPPAATWRLIRTDASALAEAAGPADQAAAQMPGGPEAPEPPADPPAPPADLAALERQRWLPVHRAALRLGQARGDLFAVLALPRHFRDAEVAAYSRALMGELGEEETALSYGAIYHPWVLTDGSDYPVRALPPDGAVSGQFAARTLSRGAWIAPANQPLAGVQRTDFSVEGESRHLYFRERINFLRQDPQGAVVATATTLAPDPALRSIGVRRLLMLLRRLVLREGSLLAFEPNDASFRQTAEARFRRLLSDLFVRGAFAGQRPQESFRVSAGPELNPPASVDQGRFVIELGVAPAQPMAFLTVRLIQAQGEQLVVTET